MYHKSRRVMRLEAKRKRCAAMRAAKERKRIAHAEPLRDVGGILTDGILGKHSIRLLARADETHWLAITLNGHHRAPRSHSGIIRCLAKLIHKHTFRSGERSESSQETQK